MRSIRIAIALYCTFFIAAVWGQDASIIQVKPPSQPIESYTYKSTPQGELNVIVHFPPDWRIQDQRPAIVFFFGGGWTNGSVEQFETQAAYFARRGMIAARADYRVQARHKTTPVESVEDGISAVRWLRKNAAVLGIDPNRIVASGGSAGGHIAMCAYTVDGTSIEGDDTSVSSKPNLLVLFNPVLNFKETVYARMVSSPQMADAISPLLHLDATVPPAIMYYGTEDRLLSQANDYLKKADELGLHAEVYTAKGEKHGFFNRSPWLEQTLYLSDKFLTEQGYLKGDPSVEPSRYSKMKRYVAGEAREEPAYRTGHFQAHFTDYHPLSCIGEMNLRMDLGIQVRRFSHNFQRHVYKIEDESFEVYVPEAYTPNEQYGLYVHISPSPSGGIPWRNFDDVLDKRKLIWIGANNTGNDQDVYNRRVALALDGAYNMQMRYNIDPNRVYVTGVSGGGRTSSMTAFHHPDVWAGGIFIIGTNYWADMKNPEEKGFFWPAKFKKPDEKFLKRAAEHGRYVFLTGDNDGNRAQTKAYYENAYSKFLKHALYIQVPDMGHTIPPVEWMEKALDFLDDPSGFPKTIP